MKDRLIPCLYYICLGECKKGRVAKHNGYCQYCNQYEPRAKVKNLNKKKIFKNNIGKDCNNE